jgi:putative ABC transport system substrate-binding protein
LDSAETHANRHHLISRRTFSCVLAGFLVAAPRLAIAQGSTVVRRIGQLNPGVPGSPEELRMAEETLRELGWVEGKNLRVERRYANGRIEALNALAEELVRAKVELLVTSGTPATIAAKRATTTIPIVFTSAGDPVLFGLVASLARPGGNVTGLSIADPEVTAKSLSLLKDLLPNLRRVGVLESSANPYYRAARGQFEQTCRLLDLAPVFVEIATAGEIVDAIAQMARQHVQAVLITSDSMLINNGFQIVDAALKHSLPTMGSGADFVRQGGALVTYSVTLYELLRRRANFIDRILRGAKTADLPVEQPTHFALVINLKMARALKLRIPQSILQRADEVIE